VDDPVNSQTTRAVQGPAEKRLNTILTIKGPIATGTKNPPQKTKNAPHERMIFRAIAVRVMTIKKAGTKKTIHFAVTTNLKAVAKKNTTVPSNGNTKVRATRNRIRKNLMTEAISLSKRNIATAAKINRTKRSTKDQLINLTEKDRVIVAKINRTERSTKDHLINLIEKDQAIAVKINRTNESMKIRLTKRNLTNPTEKDQMIAEMRNRTKESMRTLLMKSHLISLTGKDRLGAAMTNLTSGSSIMSRVKKSALSTMSLNKEEVLKVTIRIAMTSKRENTNGSFLKIMDQMTTRRTTMAWFV